MFNNQFLPQAPRAPSPTADPGGRHEPVASIHPRPREAGRVRGRGARWRPVCRARPTRARRFSRSKTSGFSPIPGSSPALRTSCPGPVTSRRSPWRGSRLSSSAMPTSGVRAFHNVCRPPQPQARRRLRETPGGRSGAPITRGTYGLDGALLVTPYFGGREPRAVPPGFDREQHGLVPVRLRDVARLDLRQPERRRAADRGIRRPAPEAARGGRPHPGPPCRHHRLRRGVAANWKLVVENFIEPYHVQFVHAATTEQPLTDHFTVNEPGCLGCRRRRLRRGRAVRTRCRRIPVSSPCSPNFVFGLYLPDEIGVQLTVPLAPGRTLQRRARSTTLDPSPSPTTAGRGGAAREALARGAPRGPRHARRASQRGRRTSEVARRRAACSRRCGKTR